MLSATRCTGSLPVFGRGSFSVSARQLSVSQVRKIEAEQLQVGADKPFGLEQVRRNTACNLRAFAIARAEFLSWPPWPARVSARRALDRLLRERMLSGYHGNAAPR